jgi:hypothetical protein
MTGIIPCLYNSYSFSKENFDGGDIVCYDIARRVVGCEREREREREKSNPPENIIIQALLPQPIFLKKKEDSDSESSEINTSSSSSSTESESEASSPTVEITVFQPNDIKQYAYNNTRTNETANTDSILWSLYIMLYGVEKYEMIENHYIESNRFKFELIEFLRDNKTILKANKVKLSSTEDTLVHKPFITLETLHAVAICKSLSLYIIQDRKYYDVSSGSGSGTPFILEKIKGKYLLYMAPDTISMKYIAYVRTNYWRMESISAPIRPISAYKLQDLIDISEKLNLPVVNVFPGKFGSIGTEKRKTKPELYEGICRYV